MWGDADLHEEELDLKVQQAALDSLKQNFLKRKAERDGPNKKLATAEPIVTREISQVPESHRDHVT